MSVALGKINYLLLPPDAFYINMSLRRNFD